MKEFTIEVDVKGEKGVKKLKDNLEDVNVEMHDISVSAKEMADSYKVNFQEIAETIILQMSKIGAIITELNTHLEQAVSKNKEAGEKALLDLDKYGDNFLVSAKIKAIEAYSIMEAYMDKMTTKTEKQSEKLAKQIEENKKLLEKSFENYLEKDKKVKDLDIKKHKEYVAELKKHQAELDAAILHTRLQYEAMSMHYDKDSEEFKKAQEDKKAALESLQKKVVEINTKIEESNLHFWEVWSKKHKEIEANIKKYEKDLGSFVDKYATGFNKLNEGINILKNNVDTLEKKEKDLNKKKYEKKIEKLDKELEKVRAEVIEREKEKERLQKEQQEAEKKAKKYREDIEKIEKAFETDEKKETDKKEETEKTDEKEENKETNPDNTTTDNEDKDKGKDKEDDNIIPVAPPTKEEKDAADSRIDELKGLATAEEDIVKERETDIINANNRIIESNRSVLLEEMRIKDEKARLKEEEARKEAEIEEKARKKREKLEKLEKKKAKAQLVVDTAVATKDIAAGIAKAWAMGPILGPPMAALVAVNGALQLKVMTEQLKYMEDGGLLRGKRHTQGGMRIEGTNIEVEGGEYVVNRVSTDKNIDLIRYINSQRRELTPADISTFFTKSSQGFEPPFSRAFESGGQLPAIAGPDSIDNETLVEAIRSIRIEPRVSVTDINRVQGEMVSVNNWVGL